MWVIWAIAFLVFSLFQIRIVFRSNSNRILPMETRSKRPGPLSDPVERSDQLLRELSEAGQWNRVSYKSSCLVVWMTLIVYREVKKTKDQSFFNIVIWCIYNTFQKSWNVVRHLPCDLVLFQCRTMNFMSYFMSNTLAGKIDSNIIMKRKQTNKSYRHILSKQTFSVWASFVHELTVSNLTQHNSFLLPPPLPETTTLDSAKRGKSCVRMSMCACVCRGGGGDRREGKVYESERELNGFYF